MAKLKDLVVVGAILGGIAFLVGRLRKAQAEREPQLTISTPTFARYVPYQVTPPSFSSGTSHQMSFAVKNTGKVNARTSPSPSGLVNLSSVEFPDLFVKKDFIPPDTVLIPGQVIQVVLPFTIPLLPPSVLPPVPIGYFINLNYLSSDGRTIHVATASEFPETGFYII